MRFTTSASSSRSWKGMGLGLAIAALSCVQGAKGLISADTIYTDSVTYCSEAKGVLVNQFDIQYHKINNSVTFSISAASVDPNLNVAANIYANAYGRNLVNLTINLCDYLQGVLCPLPMINFTGYGTYPIPTSYTDDIPGLAWTVPDLEAFARVSLTNTQTGEVAACLSATLSNGLSTQQTAVKWASAGLVIAALLVGLIHSTLRWSPSPAVYRWYDVLYVFQAAAASGLLNINYPSVYLNFVLNFPWALGLFYDGNIQEAIVEARNSTGGKLPTQAFAAVDYINRKLSPYNEATAVQLNQYFRAGATANDFHAFRALPAVGVSNSSVIPLELVKRVEIPTVSQQGIITTLRNGIPVYTNSVGIPQANAFMTIFIIYLICIAIVLGAHLVWGAVMYFADRSRRSENRGTGWVGHQRRGFWSFFAGNMMRLCLIFLFPVFIFALYQFDIGRSDSWLTIFLAAICFAWTVIGLTAVLVFAVFKSRRRTMLNISGLYTSYGWYNSAGMIYRQYRPRYHFWWYAPLALASFVRAAFIAFGYRNPWAQVIGLVVVEFLVLVTCVAFRPHKDKKGDWLGAFLALCRMIAFGLMIAFIPSMDVDPIVRTILGFVVLVFFGAPVILLFFGLLFNLAYGYAFRRHKRRIEDGTEVIGSDVRSDYGSDTPAMVQTGPALHHGDSGEVPVNAGNGFRNYDESNSLAAPPLEPAGSNHRASYRNSYHPSIDGEEPAYGYNSGYANNQYGHQPNAYGNGYAPNQYGNGYGDNQVRSAYESNGQQPYYGNNNAYDAYDNSGYGRPVNQGRRSHLEI